VILGIAAILAGGYALRADPDPPREPAPELRAVETGTPRPAEPGLAAGGDRVDRVDDDREQSESAAAEADRDTFAQLHAEASRVAKEARRAEAERLAGG
jgi:hypothetical protein